MSLPRDPARLRGLLIALAASSIGTPALSQLAPSAPARDGDVVIFEGAPAQGTQGAAAPRVAAQTEPPPAAAPAPPPPTSTAPTAAPTATAPIPTTAAPAVSPPAAPAADPPATPAPPAASTEAAAAPVPVEEPIGVLITRRARAIAGHGVARDDLAGLAAYYAAHPDKPLWISDQALTARAKTVMAEIRRADEWGLDVNDFTLPARAISQARPQLAEAEARITLAVLKYVRYAHGGRMDPTRLSETIDRRPALREPRHILDEIATAAAPDAYLRRQHPPQPQFEQLRRLYNELRASRPPTTRREADRRSPNARDPYGRDPYGRDQYGRDAAPRDPYQRGPARRDAAQDDDDWFDTPANRVRANLSRSAPPRADAAIARAPAQIEGLTARRVLLNMEQWRWMPRDLGRLYVNDNLPEFMVRVVKNGQAIFTERIVAGEVDKPTPIFSQDMQSVVFHPGWGVPNSIKVRELLPGLQRGQDTLARYGLRVMMRGQPVETMSIDWNGTDIRRLDIIQPPGPANVLGLVKFQFPNKHDVYMHDTPTKNLFEAAVRAYSHGCMRVRNPLKLAEVLCAEDQGWTPDRVAQLAGPSAPLDNKIMLAHRIPVHVTYFTVTFDAGGRPQVFRDVYGLEPLIEAGLQGKPIDARRPPRARPSDDVRVAEARHGDPRARVRVSQPSHNVFDGF